MNERNYQEMLIDSEQLGQIMANDAVLSARSYAQNEFELMTYHHVEANKDGK